MQELRTYIHLSKFMKVFFPSLRSFGKSNRRKRRNARSLTIKSYGQLTTMEKIVIQDFVSFTNRRSRACYTLDEISKGMGVTSERVRQIEDMAIRKPPSSRSDSKERRGRDN